MLLSMLKLQPATRPFLPLGRSQSIEQAKAGIARWNGLTTHHYYTEPYQIPFLKSGSGSLGRDRTAGYGSFLAVPTIMALEEI